MSDYTPGPWGTFEIQHDGDDPETRTGVCAFEGDYMLAEVGFDRPNEAEANARLIASAPDLLKAAREAEQRLLDLFDGDAEDATIIDALRAAIAKAEGVRSST